MKPEIPLRIIFYTLAFITGILAYQTLGMNQPFHLTLAFVSLTVALVIFATFIIKE